MVTYVYRVTNTVNGKVYFGKTSNVANRWYHHVWGANHNSRAYFHKALRKHGVGAFTLEVLSAHETDAEAGREEVRLIAQAPSGTCYNTAPGGTGDRTMTQKQIEQQYRIKPENYDLFRRLFEEGLVARAMAEHLGVPLKAVRSCARRLGLSFKMRRAAVPGRVRLRKPRRYVSRAQYTPDERSRLRSIIATQNNIARGATPKIQRRIRTLYFQKHLTAQETADRLGISKGTVRATINRFYAKLSPKEHARLKREHGSAVRTGTRNPNAGS